MTTVGNFQSTLIVSNNFSVIRKQISLICLSLENLPTPNNPDILNIDQNSGWGIDVIRKIKNFLSQKPFCHQNKIVIISDAQQLNLESQNALLKTLEEPGKDNYLILTAPNSSALLPTIISRVHIIKAASSNQVPKTDLLSISHNIQTNLLSSEKIAQNKNQILSILEEQLLLQKQQLLNHPTPIKAGHINKIIKAISMIKHNVDPKSALDYYFLS